MTGNRLLADDAGGRRLSANEVRDTVFPSAGFSRGLNTEHVTMFMRRVAAEMHLLEDEKAELAQEVEQLEATVERLQAEAAQANGRHAGLPPVEVQSVHVLRRAQESADRLLADAQGQARSLVEGGRRQRENILTDGQAKARSLLQNAIEEAGREAARIAAQAPIDAQRQLAQYQGLADAVRAALTANLRSLTDQVAVWEAQERQGIGQPLPQRRPATGPQQTAPLA
jgi:DivIVA domain-containing protein